MAFLTLLDILVERRVFFDVYCNCVYYVSLVIFLAACLADMFSLCIYLLGQK